MKDRCKKCGNALIEIDARGTPATDKIKCEINGQVHNETHVCERFVRASEPEGDRNER